MPDFRIAYFAHTLRSNCSNGNAHFLRGLLRALRTLGHDVTAYEPEAEWSIDNLRQEPLGTQSLDQFMEVYADLDVQTYAPDEVNSTEVRSNGLWRQRLRGVKVVVLHEWNPPALASLLLTLRDELGFKLLFHDTHHRAPSSPESFAKLGLEGFDGILAFGEALRRIYLERYKVRRVWTLHEAADTTVFHPIAWQAHEQDVVWIGNWGEGERAAEIGEYVVGPAAALDATCKVFGVRYPQEGLDALALANIAYGGYLPNLEAPVLYARSRLTLHIPRQHYTAVMTGIPTIRVFEALACGIPLVSAPWEDTEGLFRPGDFQFVEDGASMLREMQRLLTDPEAARAQAERGLETILARHRKVLFKKCYIETSPQHGPDQGSPKRRMAVAPRGRDGESEHDNAHFHLKTADRVRGTVPPLRCLARWQKMYVHRSSALEIPGDTHDHHAAVSL